MKQNNNCITWIPEGEEEQRIEKLFETVMIENFPNLMKEKSIQIQGVERVKIKSNPKRPTPRHI